jgi:hypothetical protein
MAWNDETLKLKAASKSAREVAALKDVDGAKQLHVQLQQVLQRDPFAALGELSQRLFGTFGSPETPPTPTPNMMSVAEDEEALALALAAMTHPKGTREPAREFLAWLRAHNLELDEILSDDCGVHARVVPRGETTHHPAVDARNDAQHDARNDARPTIGDHKLPRPAASISSPAASISSPTTGLAPHRLTLPRLPSSGPSTSCSIKSPPAAGEPNTTLHPGTPSPPPSQWSGDKPNGTPPSPPSQWSLQRPNGHSNGPRKGASAHTDAGRSPQASRRANGSEGRMQVPSTAPAGSERMQRLDFETLELFEARQGGTLALDSRRNPTSSSRERLPSMQLSSTPIERELLGASRLTPAAHYVEAAAAIRGTVDDERARMSAVWSQLDLRTHAAPRRAYSAFSPPHSGSLLPTVLSPHSGSLLPRYERSCLTPRAVARLTADCLTMRCAAPAGVGTLDCT